MGGNQLIMNGGEEFSSDDRKLISYLKLKIDGNAPPPNEILEESDFYKLSPEQLSERHATSIKEGKLYVFTKVSRKHPNSTCPVVSRIVHGFGAWISQGKGKYITFKTQKIGSKLLLHFKREVGQNAHLHRIPTNWVMEEYKTIRPSQAGATYVPDWVLCKVYQDGEAVAISNNQANQVQQNNNNNSNVRDGGTNELMTNRPCQLFTWRGTSEVVAVGTLLSTDPRRPVGGVPLGAYCWEVSVSRVDKNEDVYRYAPTSNFRSLNDAIGGTIAWPIPCIRPYDGTLEPGIAVGEAAVVCQDPWTIVNDLPLGLDYLDWGT